jgi:hypothetical protein
MEIGLEILPTEILLIIGSFCGFKNNVIICSRFFNKLYSNNWSIKKLRRIAYRWKIRSRNSLLARARVHWKTEMNEITHSHLLFEKLSHLPITIRMKMVDLYIYFRSKLIDKYRIYKLSIVRPENCLYILIVLIMKDWTLWSKLKLKEVDKLNLEMAYKNIYLNTLDHIGPLVFN